MLITGIRHKINSELDSRRSALFTRYLIHFFRMFGWLGIIFPVLIVVDYFSGPKTNDEIVTNKYYVVMDHLNHIEYHFLTDSYRFISDVGFFENTNIEDRIILYRTPIFKTVTYVSSKVGQSVYVCKPPSIYGWPLIIAALTFILSILVIIKTWNWQRKRKFTKYDSVINIGVVNLFLCTITIVAILFHIPY